MKAVGWFCYYAARAIVQLLAKVWWRVDYRGLENIPKTGAFLLCPIHRSYIDGPLTVSFTRRRMRYLAKETLFTKWTNALFTSMGAIKVNRGTPDRHSLHTCMDALSSGYPLVLFPEGTRQAGPTVVAPNEGAAYLALRAGVPVVPVGIGGSYEAMPKGARFFKPSRISVIIGEPIPFAIPESGRVPRSAIREGTDKIAAHIQKLYDEAQILAGQAGTK